MIDPVDPTFERRVAGDVPVVLRPLKLRDISGLLTLERAMIEDGAGMVRDQDDVPSDEGAMRREVQPWLDGPLRPPNGLLLVAAAEQAGVVPILGSAEIRRLGPAKVRHVAMLGLGIHPSFRRKGLGRALVESLLRWSKAKGILRVELSVRADNLPARALYQSLGFAEEGRRRAFIRLDEGHFIDDLLMARLLDENLIGKPKARSEAKPSEDR